MRAARLAAVLLLVSFAGCPEEPPPEPPPPAPVARLVKAVGRVELSRDGGTAAATAPAPLFSGDVVRTGAGASALLKGGSVEVELDEHTVFPIGAGLTDVRLEAGEVTLFSEGEAAFDTARGTADLAGGSRVRLSLRDEDVVLEVGSGAVSLRDVDGGASRAAAGERVRLRIGEVELEPITDEQTRVRLGIGPVELEAPPPAVRAAVEAGKPLLKRPGATRPTPAPKTSELEEGTTGFVTPAGAALRLEAGGVVARVAPGAAGSVSTPTRDGQALELPLALDSGQAALRLGPQTRLRLTGAPPATLSSQEANAVLVTGKAGRRLDVVTGTVRVEVEGQAPVNVPAGQSVTLAAQGSPEVKPLPRPALLVPYGKRVTVNSLTVKELGLRLPSRRVRVEVASDPGFTQLVAAGEAEDFVTVPAPPGRQLFWRFPGEEGAVVQGQVRLRAEPQPRSGGTRGDVIAETGKKATVYYQGSVPPLTITFGAVPEAKSYLLKVYAAGALTTPVHERKSDTNKVLVEAGVLQEGSYVWFASPLDANGRELSGGRMNQMELVFDNALTTLVITSPREGAKSADVVAAGTAPAGGRLQINGKPVALGASGRFSVPLGSVDAVVFTLTTPDGGESVWLRRLKR